MAGREGSVAPRERVNIRYKTERNGVREEVELPFKELVLGDFRMRPDSTAIEDRETIKVNKSTFDSVLRDHQLELHLDVEDVISGRPGDMLPVHLTFDSLKAFGPAEVARQVPELRRLLEIREALKALKGPLGSVRVFRERLAALLENDSAVTEILAQLEAQPAPELPAATAGEPNAKE